MNMLDEKRNLGHIFSDLQFMRSDNEHKQMIQKEHI